MKRSVTMLMFVLACCLFAIAQSSTSGDSMKQDNMKHSDMMGKKMSMTGCVAEKDGKYMMMNKEHPEGVQLMSSEDMKAHVGHKMQVSGMMQDMSDDSMKSDDNMKYNDNMKSDEKMKDDKMKHGEMGMKVSSMKMMSDHCDMSQMMEK